MTRRETAGRVAELMGDPGYRSLLAAVRERLEAQGEVATLTLRGLDLDARRALADLLQRPRRPGPVARVRVDDLDRALRASRVGTGLREVLEAASGPLADRRAERTAHRAARASLWEELSAHPLVRERPELASWVERLRADGALFRASADVAAARRLAERALDVVTLLPADGTPLSVLAAEATGDPHALDRGSALGGLVLRAIAALDAQDGLPSGAGEQRALWATVGVVSDPVSTHVLALGLRLGGDSLVSRVLSLHADAGEPVRLTLRELQAHEWTTQPGPVFVCENPQIVVAAADRLGAASRPLICVEGMPGAAADALLRGIAGAGGSIRFHADFDWGGVRIGNLVVARYGGVPWRFGAADYESAVSAVAKTDVLPPSGTVASWDDRLGPLMSRTGRRVPEESVVTDLLSDLALPDRAPGSHSRRVPTRATMPSLSGE